MGLMYRPVRISSIDGNRSAVVVALVDTGADETVVSERVMKELEIRIYGQFRTKSASGHDIYGRRADVELMELSNSVGGKMTVGVTNAPFMVDEGIEALLGVDFLQHFNIQLNFTNNKPD